MMPNQITATEALVQKLHPRRFTEMSSRMAAIVGYVLGQEWTNPTIAWLSVTVDGHVVSDSTFIGSAEDLDRNVRTLLEVADLSPEELAEWKRRYVAKVDDWRNGGMP